MHIKMHVHWRQNLEQSVANKEKVREDGNQIVISYSFSKWCHSLMALVWFSVKVTVWCCIEHVWFFYKKWQNVFFFLCLPFVGSIIVCSPVQCFAELLLAAWGGHHNYFTFPMHDLTMEVNSAIVSGSIFYPNWFVHKSHKLKRAWSLTVAILSPWSTDCYSWEMHV